ncbi:uncharacterized protein LOC119070631 [Bradysia coprophila]|uniref:uncharacterized protein LOC119070631 n=1 Tax=Bradysia coprophila TaxID=38358 RepID=UPI00187DC90E|nr:uncharacterized protein LOC119070631 [Bradysia coprophila]
MKFIVFIIIIVSAIALSVSSDCSDGSVNNSQNDDKQFTFFSTYFDYLLNEQYEKTSTEIADAWLKCNETYSVPFDEGIDMFQNPPRGDERYMRREAKCLVDCTMRNTGVMTDEGFQVEQYMRHVKQLRFNYTSFDIDKRPAGAKRDMLATIWKRSSGCGSYGTILNYSWAARQCSDVRDPEGDNCETAWLIMRCMMNRKRERLYNSPFFPVLLKELQ